MKKLCMAILVSLALAVPASAAPNFYGPTGLFKIPTANVLKPREWNLDYHYVSDQDHFVAGNVGVTKGLEVGALFFQDVSNGGGSGITANAKYQLLYENTSKVGLAVGWQDIADALDTSVYVVASKQVGMMQHAPINLHLGIGGGVFDNVFAGGDLYLVQHLQGILEFDGVHVNGGVRVGVGDFRIDAGLVSGQFGVGTSYNTAF
ncbi:MAG TPA: YjbH domain-containing protein [Armatimonadota bacterium]|nr:YjbH domain-containing protein [Armatimonadota bacterium]